MVDALLVCEDKKTLAALRKQLVEAPDTSNMADFLRISPWRAEDVRARLRAHQVAWLTAEAERADAPKVLFINIDDSLGEKDKHTRHLEPVDWFFDHSESTKTKPRFKNAFCYVVCTMRAGQNVATVDVQLYLREKTVRRLNRKRPKKQRLSFRSKYRISRQMLVALRPHLPTGWRVYVQFDRMSASTFRRGTLGRNPRRTLLVRTSLARPNKPCKGTPGAGRAKPSTFFFSRFGLGMFSAARSTTSTLTCPFSTARTSFLP